MEGDMRAQITRFTSLQESGARPSVRADDGGRVYRGVTIIKSGLGNKRDKNFYPPEVLKTAVDQRLFEGLRAYADHQTSVDEEIQPERSIRDIVGVYTNTRFSEAKGGRVIGDLRILRAHKWLSDMVDELIEIGQSDKVGISINGRGQTEPTKMQLEEAGEEVEVNKLKSFIDLRSADVVTEAGAGGGFPQLLESARQAAAKERTMSKKELIAAIQEAAKAGDLERVKDLTAKLSESDEAETETEEAEEEAEGEGEGDGDGADELEDAIEEAHKAAQELEADEEDDSPMDCSEADDPDECEERMAAREAGAVTVATKKQGIKGIGGSNTGTALKRGTGGKGKKNSGKGFPGFKTVEHGVEIEDLMAEVAALREQNQRLTARVEKLASRNNRLAEALRIRASADQARKLLKESGIPEDLQAELLRRMVGKSEEHQRREVTFTKRLLEAARGRATDPEDDFEAVEGAGASLRESYGETGDQFSGVLQRSGLPLKG